MSNRHLLIVVLVGVLSPAAFAATIYVDADNCPGPGDGSEADPYCSVQVAINSAMEADEIVVAPGTYLETINFLGKGVTLRSSGGPEVTTIDGQQAGQVITCDSGEGPGTVLDGFTVTNGSAGNGGGMRNFGSSPTVTNCVFASNSASRGAGMLNDQGSNPTVTNCMFASNAGEYGGGMYNAYGSHSTVTNCTFEDNSAAWFGGGMDNKDSNPTVANCTFTSNWGQYGGGMFNEANSSPTVTNCTFGGNSDNAGGGGIYCTSSSSPSLANCILWGDTPGEIALVDSTITVTYSDVQGGWPGTGNIDADPVFVGAYGRLLPGSPCIDAADNTAVPADTEDLDGDGDTTEPIPIDLEGNPRFVDDVDTLDTGLGDPPIVDMGAYEFQGTIPFTVRVEGQLQAVSGDPHDLDGATVLITYSANTTDTATESGSGSGYAYSFFDVFTMEVTITNRPNAAPDITGLTVPNDPVVHNHFPPSTDNDDFTCDSRSFDGVPGIGSAGCLNVDLLFVDFGSQSFFPGDASVTDLSFFGPLIGSDLVGGFLGPLTAGDCPFGDEYDVMGTTITVVGEGAGEIAFDPPDESPAEGEAIREATGDLDGNGTIDVVVVIPNEDPTVPGTVQVFLNQGTDELGQWLGFVANPPITVGRDPSDVAVGLFNGDSYLDVAVTNAGDDTVSILLNDGLGMGNFIVQAPPVAVGDAPSGVTTLEFNGDGNTDLAVTNEGDQNLVILLGDGAGGFSLPPGADRIGIPLGSSPVGLLADDFDNNDEPDVAGPGFGAGLRQSGVVFVLLGTPGGGFAPVAVYDVGQGPRDIASGDLDGDGFSDIAAVNADDGTVSILLNLGDGTFAPAFEVSVGGMPRSIEAADLDGDSDLDLAVAADAPGTGPSVQVLINRTGEDVPPGGGVVFDPPLAFSVNADPNFVVAADLNGDGLPDLLTANADDGPSGGSVTALVNNPTAPPIPCPADLDGDGSVNVIDLLLLLVDWGQCPPAPDPCPADVNDDGSVNVLDLMAMLGEWGPCPGAPCVWDVNGDGVVDQSDLQQVFNNFGPCDGCPEDVNGNGVVDWLDAVVVATQFGPCP
jgi:hypothetical protein